MALSLLKKFLIISVFKCVILKRLLVSAVYIYIEKLLKKAPQTNLCQIKH